MIKNSDINKINKFDYTVQNQKNEIINLDLNNSLIISNVKKYNFSFDILKKRVKIDTDWETLGFSGTLKHQYKFWEINFQNIDISLLPFIVVDVLVKNNTQNLVGKINKIFQIDTDNNVKLMVGINFSEYVEMEQYNPIKAKLLVYFNNIPIIRKQNLHPECEFTSMGGGMGG